MKIISATKTSLSKIHKFLCGMEHYYNIMMEVVHKCVCGEVVTTLWQLWGCITVIRWTVRVSSVILPINQRCPPNCFWDKVLDEWVIEVPSFTHWYLTGNAAIICALNLYGIQVHVCKVRTLHTTNGTMQCITNRLKLTVSYINVDEHCNTNFWRKTSYNLTSCCIPDIQVYNCTHCLQALSHVCGHYNYISAAVSVASLSKLIAEAVRRQQLKIACIRI